MFKTEKSLYQSLKANLPKVHWQRIETGALQQGVPDVNGCYGGKDFWLELKVSTTDTVSLTALQCAWHMRRCSSGGATWVLVSNPSQSTLALIPGNQSVTLRDHGLSSCKAFTFKAPIDWPGLLRAICMTDSLDPQP